MTVKGISIVIPGPGDELSKTGFYIDAQDGTQMFLEIHKTPAIFTIHRDIFQKMEWVIMMVEVD